MRPGSKTRPAAISAARAPSAIDRLPLAALSLGTLGLGAWLAIAELVPVRVDLGRPVSTSMPISQERIEEAILASVRRYDEAHTRGDKAEARAALMEARTGLVSLIAASPAHPLHWVQLAEIEQRLASPLPRVEAMLRQSAAMGHLEFPAVTRRIELVLRIWPFLSEEARALADRDLATLLAMQPKHRVLVFLVQTAARLPADRLAVVTGAVARHAPAAMKDFEFYRRFPPKEILLP